jgi:hypothetical protein
MATTPTLPDPYCDVAYAEAYFDARFKADMWNSASADDKLRALHTASNMIDALPLVLSKASTAQARAFPRSGYEDDGVPEEVQKATCEIALALLEGRTPRTMAAHSAVGSESQGQASTSYPRGKLAGYDGAFGLPSIEAAQLLAPWISDGAGAIALDRC